MKDWQPATWFEDKNAKGLSVWIGQAELEIQIRFPDHSFRSWPTEALDIKAIPGSQNKWYIRQKTAMYPLLVVENHLPGITGKKAKCVWPHISISALAALGFVLLLFASLVLLLWKGLPLMADLAAQKVPVQWEKEIGLKIREQTLKSVSVDTEKTKLLNQFLKDVRFSSGKGDGIEKPQFYVIRNSEFNAFALPGGTIMVHSAALEKLQTPAALLALIGHENGHVQGRHSMRTLTRSLGLYALFSVLIGDLGGLAAVLADNAQNLQNLSYSRDFEREADRSALDFLCTNQSDPNGLVQLMNTLQQVSGTDGQGIPVILSSHPLSKERLDAAFTMLKKSPCREPVINQNLDSLFQQLKKPN